ncbi:hypothetical protein [Amycolatopsis sp. lyj-112]|uniref:hypothetical protein n=1 Tax=Amycolatopsis sp. lyj-112 TaxID=2789288 RepID=UPI00397BAB2A
MRAAVETPERQRQIAQIARFDRTAGLPRTAREDVGRTCPKPSRRKGSGFAPTCHRGAGGGSTEVEGGGGDVFGGTLPMADVDGAGAGVSAEHDSSKKAVAVRTLAIIRTGSSVTDTFSEYRVHPFQ